MESLDQSCIAELRPLEWVPQLGVQEGLLEEGVSKLGPEGREEPARLLRWAGAHPHSTLLTWWTFLPGFSLR